MSPSKSTILLEGGIVISFDAASETLKPLPNTSLLIVGDTIADIFPSDEQRELPPGVEKVDVRGKIISPGFVDTHHHGWQTAYKTIAADSHISEYFVRYGWAGKCYEDFTPKDVYLGHLVSQYEMLEAGTTSVLEHAHSTFNEEFAEWYLKGTLETGIRTWFAQGIQDYSRCRHDSSSPLEQIQLYRKLSQDPRVVSHPLVSFGLGYDGWHYENETTRAVVDLVKAEKPPVVTSHFSGPYYTTNSLLHLKSLGLLDGANTPFVFSHASFNTFEEAQLMRKHNVNVSTTPQSEQLWGTDLTPTAYNLDQASLGVDNPWSCAADMASQGRLYLHRVREQFFNQVTRNRQLASVTPMTTDQAFLLVTRNGGLAFHRDDIGVLKVGAKADILVFNGDSFNMLGWKDPVAAVLLHSHPSDIESVVVGGQWRKRHGKLVLLPGATDLQEVKKLFLQSAERLQRLVLDRPRPVFQGQFMPGIDYATPYQVSLTRRTKP